MAQDAWTRGAILIFDRKGKLAHAVHEPVVGQQLDMEEIRNAVQNVKNAA